jgi:large subunit ribosomal protein L19
MAPIPVLANPGADTIDWMLTMNLIQTLDLN